jgi:hypothetical protein
VGRGFLYRKVGLRHSTGSFLVARTSLGLEKSPRLKILLDGCFKRWYNKSNIEVRSGARVLLAEVRAFVFFCPSFYHFFLPLILPYLAAAVKT